MTSLAPPIGRPKARQMWACNVCEFERQWGNGYPDHAQPKTPKLYCASCKLLTPHYFIGLMDEWESA